MGEQLREFRLDRYDGFCHQCGLCILVEGVGNKREHILSIIADYAKEGKNTIELRHVSRHTCEQCRKSGLEFVFQARKSTRQKLVFLIHVRGVGMVN